MAFKKDEGSFFFKDALEKEKDELKQLEKKSTKKVLKLYDFGASKLRAEIKKHPAQYFFLFISTFMGSVITSSIALFGFSGNILAFIQPKPTHQVEAVVATGVPQKVVESEKYDPLLLASKLRKQDTDFELIDIRSEADFKKGHILNAQSVPVYDSNMVNKNGDLDVASIKKAFEKYLKTDKLLIIYAQNSYSTIPTDIAALLTNGQKRAKALAVGWDEWLHLQGK
jgi:rhodanese-related sulfurtransferase